MSEKHLSEFEAYELLNQPVTRFRTRAKTEDASYSRAVRSGGTKVGRPRGELNPDELAVIERYERYKKEAQADLE